MTSEPLNSSKNQCYALEAYRKHHGSQMHAAVVTAIERQQDEIERLTRERDEWAAKWQRVRRELAELKYPGMTGTVRALGSGHETGARRYDGTRESFYCPNCECAKCGNTRPAEKAGEEHG